MNAREEILGRIATALADSPAPATVRRDYRRSGEAAAEGHDLVAMFVERVADYRATVLCCGPDSLPQTLAAQVGDRAMVVAEGFPPDWLGQLPRRPVVDHPALRTSQLDELDGLVSLVAVAIAETGTIVLDSGPGQGRRALSLVPDFHCAVVAREQIVASVPDAIAALDPTRPLTWISGPSSTSDIELSRVEGVHGPRNLTVIVVG